MNLRRLVQSNKAGSLPFFRLEIWYRLGGRDLLMSEAPAVTDLPQNPALAVLDGALCRLNRRGTRTVWHAPLATAVVEFHHGALRTFVREHPYGLLPGIPNLYCLDGALRLQWLAEWPNGVGACTKILGESGDALQVESASGAVVSLDAHTGALLGVSHPAAAVS